MKISYKLILIIGLPLIVGTIFISVLFYFVTQQSVEDRSKAQLESVVVIKSNQVKDSILESLQYVESVGAHTELVEASEHLLQFPASSTVQQATERLLEEHGRYGGNLQELFLLNPAGKIVASTDRGQEGKYSNDAYLTEGIKNPFIESFYYDTILGKHAITVAVPMRNASGTFGVLAGRVNISKISEIMMEDPGLGKTGETYLINATNLLVSNLRYEKNTAFQKFIYRDWVQDCFNGMDGSHIMKNYAGVLSIGVHKLLPSVGACLVGEISLQEAMAPAEKLKQISLLLGIVSILFSMLFGFSLSRAIVVSIKKLQTKAREIINGHYDAKVSISANDELGELAHAFNQMSDAISEKTRSIQEERARLVTAIESTPLGIVIADMSFNVQVSNSALKQFLGISGMVTVPAIAKKFEGMLDLMEEFKKCSSPDVSVNLQEIHFGSKYFHIFLSLIVNRFTGTAIGYIAVFVDITEEKDLDKAKTEFISIASHEMRTPLTIIRGNTELLLESMGGNEETTKMLGSIERNSVRLLNIVNDFLDLTQLEGGAVKLKEEKFNFFDLAEDAVSDMQGLVKEKKISLVIEKPAEPMPDVLADHERTRQAIVNLVGNAIHYTIQGEVRVMFRRENGFVKLICKDTGSGIDDRQKAMLFQRFRASRSTFLHSREYGSGLGLYITKLLVERMGGVAMLEETGIGKGSTFSITLPIARS